MSALINGKTIADAVALDGLPRVADADDGSRHVLYLDAWPLPHSMLAADWLSTRGPLPTDPTPAQSAAAIAARETERQTKRDKAVQKRARILALAADAVGQPVDKLSAKQIGALLALLHPELVDDALMVRPVDEWVPA